MTCEEVEEDFSRLYHYHYHPTTVFFSSDNIAVISVALTSGKMVAHSNYRRRLCQQGHDFRTIIPLVTRRPVTRRPVTISSAHLQCHYNDLRNQLICLSLAAVAIWLALHLVMPCPHHGCVLSTPSIKSNSARDCIFVNINRKKDRYT